MFEVVHGGAQTTVQDLGRRGFGAAGVPTGGAMDRFALAAANRLLDNPPGAAGLEVLLGGLRLRCTRDTAICVTGADLQCQLDGTPLPLWAVHQIDAGALIAFAGRRSGARAYLAAAGGFAVPPVLGSQGTYLPGGWGGYQGRALQSGDQLDVGGWEHEALEFWLAPEQRPLYSSFPTLRCVPGPHTVHFSAEAQAALWSSVYHLAPRCDRMGYRLDGPVITAHADGNLPSLGVLPGAIQVPPQGQPILLMVDAQTTGGYPVIATVIDADLPLAAQLLPGDRLRFRAVSPGQARDALRRQHDRLATIDTAGDVVGVPV